MSGRRLVFNRMGWDNKRTITDIVHILDSKTALARFAAKQMSDCIRMACDRADLTRRESGFSLALSGGNTPKETFATLASPEFVEKIPWSQADIFWVDERCVPPEHPRSNFKLANEAFLSRLPVCTERVHRMHGELTANEAAAAYEAKLRRVFPEAVTREAGYAYPRIDFALLGLGDDGHLASLFPGMPALNERSRWVVGTQEPKSGEARISLTFPVLEAAHDIAFLVEGAGKAKILASILRGNSKSDDALPASRLQPMSGTLLWFIDEAAAAELG